MRYVLCDQLRELMAVDLLTSGFKGWVITDKPKWRCTLAVKGQCFGIKRLCSKRREKANALILGKAAGLIKEMVGGFNQLRRGSPVRVELVWIVALCFCVEVREDISASKSINGLLRIADKH